MQQIPDLLNAPINYPIYFQKWVWDFGINWSVGIYALLLVKQVPIVL
jgi:hypothetical protein